MRERTTVPELRVSRRAWLRKRKPVEKVMRAAIAEAVQQAKEDFESTCPS